MERKSFLKGAFILGIGGISVQILGAIFRIPLANIIGATGMGYFQTAYSIYIFILVFSTIGIPAAISKIVSEKDAVNNSFGVYKVLKVSFTSMLVMGIISSGILFFGAKTIAIIFKNNGAYYSIMSIAPALLFVPIMATYRGYFQGLQDMKPTALSQIIEQLFRVAIGLTLAYLLVSKNLELAAAGASSGASFGAVVGTLILIKMYMNKRELKNKSISNEHSEDESYKTIVYKLFSMAIPITIGAAIMPIMNLIDILAIRRLQETGFTCDTANILYGQLAGLAGPIINIPQALSMSIAMSLVPTIAASYRRKDYNFLQHNIIIGLRVSMMIGIPCSFGLMILSQQIMLLIYPMQKESALNTASILFILSSGVVFLAIAQTFTGILQGLGETRKPVLNLLVGVLFKIIFTFFLVGIPSINIKGAAVGTTIGYIVIAGLNLITVKQHTSTKFNCSLIFVRTILAGIIMSICVLGTYNLIQIIMPSNFATIIAILIGAIVYGIALIALRSITIDDLKMMPKGEQIVKILEKFRFVSSKKE